MSFSHEPPYEDDDVEEPEIDQEDFEEEPPICEKCGQCYCDGECDILADEELRPYYSDEEEEQMPGIPIELPDDMLNDIVERSSAALTAKLEPTLKKMLEEKLDEAWEGGLHNKMQTMAENLIQEWMDKPRTKTDSYGEPVGKSTTFSAEVLKGWQEYISRKVDARGNDSSYGDTSRLQWMIRSGGIEPIEKAAKEEIAKISAEAKKQVTAAVSAFIAQQLTPTINLPKIGA